jgi:hypothetical protein
MRLLRVLIVLAAAASIARTNEQPRMWTVRQTGAIDRMPFLCDSVDPRFRDSRRGRCGAGFALVVDPIEGIEDLVVVGEGQFLCRLSDELQTKCAHHEHFRV